MMNMRNLFLKTGILAAIALFPLSAMAEKIVVVNMNELVNSYFKRDAVMRAVEQELLPASQSLEQMAVEFEQLQVDFNEARQIAENTLLSEEMRAQGQRNAQRLFAQLQQRGQEFEVRRDQFRNTVQARNETALRGLYKEVARRTAIHAREMGAVLVLDRSGMTTQGLPTVLFADSSLDITEEMKQILNREAPRS